MTRVLNREKESNETLLQKKIDPETVSITEGCSSSVFFFVLLLSLARIANGFFSSVTGPTLPSLADNCNVHNSDVSIIFTFRAVGIFVGACLVGRFFPKLGKDGKWKMFSIGVILLINGVGLALIPIINTLPILGIVIMITGGSTGWLNSGITSLFLTTWGPEKSRPYIASSLFSFSIGAILAPLLVGVFKPADALNKCDNRNETITLNSSNKTGNSPFDDMPFFDGLDTAIIPPYWIIAGVVILTGALTIVSALSGLAGNVQTELVETLETREEDPWQNSSMIIYFMLVMAMFFCACGMDNVFSSYLYIYAMCSETYNWSPTKANNLVTTFWIVFGISRAVGIFTTAHLKPWLYILIGIIGSVVGVSLILGYDYGLGPNEPSDAGLMVAVIIFALFVACIYGCATNYTNEFTNMSLSYIFIAQLGTSFGAMSLPTITGNLVSKDPIWFGWIVLMVSVGCLLFEGLIYLQGSRIQQLFALSNKQ